MAATTTYMDLLIDYAPRPIRTKAAYIEALSRIEELMSSTKMGRAESEMVELLATLIEQYESVEYPTPSSTPAEMLEHLIEVRGITNAELSRATGIPRSVITNMLAGRRAISKATAVKLSKYFRVSLSLFIDKA